MPFPCLPATVQAETILVFFFAREQQPVRRALRDEGGIDFVELQSEHLGVPAGLRHQFRVGAPLGEFAVLHYEDFVAIYDGWKGGGRLLAWSCCGRGGGGLA